MSIRTIDIRSGICVPPATFIRKFIIPFRISIVKLITVVGAPVMVCELDKLSEDTAKESLNPISELTIGAENVLLRINPNINLNFVISLEIENTSAYVFPTR